MAIEKSGEHWHGDDLDDLAAYVREFQAGGYPVDTVVECVCTCGARTFRVNIDDGENTQRRCRSCGTVTFIGDGAEHWDDASAAESACPCGGDEFAAAVGFALTADGEVRWLSVGLRCLTDGTLGVYADLKIDYSPSRHLLTQV